MTETQERFLRTILSRVPLESVVELHLFPPIRRGTVETGVAVIATVMPPALVVDVDSDMGTEAVVDDAVSDEDIDTADVDILSAAQPEEADADVEAPASSGDASSAVDGARHADPDAFDDSSPYAAESAEVVSGDPDADAAPAEDTQPAFVAPTASARMCILTANYRHTIKGLERGKWVADVQEEADAPLDAVEAVLRGVRHRSTEPADPELVSHDTLAALLAQAAVAPAA
jgi:hypothetical protein